MDVLVDKQGKNYNYISRYSQFPFYYNTLDDKYIYGITSQLKDDVTYVLHKVQEYDTFESLSNYYYGRPDLFWVITDFNKIQDPFIELWGNIKELKVPTLSNLSFNK